MISLTYYIPRAYSLTVTIMTFAKPMVLETAVVIYSHFCIALHILKRSFTFVSRYSTSIVG